MSRTEPQSDSTRSRYLIGVVPCPAEKPAQSGIAREQGASGSTQVAGDLYRLEGLRADVPFESLTAPLAGGKGIGKGSEWRFWG